MWRKIRGESRCRVIMLVWMFLFFSSLIEIHSSPPPCCPLSTNNYFLLCFIRSVPVTVRDLIGPLCFWLKINNIYMIETASFCIHRHLMMPVSMDTINSMQVLSGCAISSIWLDSRNIQFQQNQTFSFIMQMFAASVSSCQTCETRGATLH